MFIKNLTSTCLVIGLAAALTLGLMEERQFSYPIKGKYMPIGPGSDSAMYNTGFLEGDIQVEQLFARNAVANPALLWPLGVIVYKVDDDIGCPDSPQCDILMKAMDQYHSKSCIRFKEWSGEKNYVHIFFNTEDSGACWSPVGRTGKGAQRLSLGQRCWYLGIVIHELGHAAGFWHEMNRPDRDDWIYIYWSNIIPSFYSAFSKRDSKAVNFLGESFDYKSIMMYDEYAFSKDGVTPTLQAKTNYKIGPIWKKPGLSNSDVRRLQRLYKCDGSLSRTGFPYDVICTFNEHTCGFKNGGMVVWNWKSINKTDGYVYSTFQFAGTTPGYLISINYHPLTETGQKRSPLGCVRFWYMIESDSRGSLKAYLDKVSQVSTRQKTTFELWSNETSLGRWVHVQVPLYVSHPFKLIFKSEFGRDSTKGTIALDDVEVLYAECTGEYNGAAALSSITTETAKQQSDPTPITTSTMDDQFDTTISNDIEDTTNPLQLI